MTIVVLQEAADSKMVEFGELDCEECFLYEGNILRKTQFADVLSGKYNTVYVSDDNFVKISDDTLVTPVRKITISYEV